MSGEDAAPDGAASVLNLNQPILNPGQERMEEDMETTSRGKDHVDAASRKIFKNYNYQNGDCRPYRVIVENTDVEKRKVVNRLQIGIMLHQNGFDKCIDDIRKTARNKVTVYVGNIKDANRLANCQNLNLQGFKSYIPKQFVTVTGVISGIPLEMKDEEVKHFIKAKAEIDSVFRMHRYKDKKKEPTYKMGVVFRTNTLPNDISIYSVIHKVQPYIRKPIICFKCLRYNHLSKNCKALIEKCMSCAVEHSTENSCNVLKCLYCPNSNHKTTDKVCPRWKKENDLQAKMAKKCMTYQEARQYYEVPTENMFDVLRTTEDFPTIAESYSRVAASGRNFPQQLQPKRSEWSSNDKRNRSKKENKEPNKLNIWTTFKVKQSTLF
ncbi:uncharacterized protein LOC129737843 [Uranotaenia lowii]|uniref:uncharacterized protein LOC129737843 n=1 Tax=Uranotaenia lowii TaxID=190385 RepID=UPI00247926FA|nr:uncharacterized protein LOC129737843 [Uranotaenia lowii]